MYKKYRFVWKKKKEIKKRDNYNVFINFYVDKRIS